MVVRHSATPGSAVVRTGILDLKAQIGAVDMRADLRWAGRSSTAPNEANFAVFSAEKRDSGGKQCRSGRRGRPPFQISDPFDCAQDGCADFKSQIAGRRPPGGVSSFMQSEPNFSGGQNPSNFRTFIHLHQDGAAGRAPRRTQSKPICGGRLAAVDDPCVGRYNDAGAGVKDRPGQRECLR